MSRTIISVDGRFEWDEEKDKLNKAERIAEIKAFKNTNFSDCPVMTEEELRSLRPRYPGNFKQEKQTETLILQAVNV